MRVGQPVTGIFCSQTQKNLRIHINISGQFLDLIDNQETGVRFRISTARNGTGQRKGSYCTPLGRHIVRAKIGAGCVTNTVFVGRRPTGEIYSADLASRFHGRDWILTRILWLSGCEPGFNRMGDVDTMRRYIYIHGSPDSVVMGKPGSIGCIRMHNSDIIRLFDRVTTGTVVEIAP